MADDDPDFHTLLDDRGILREGAAFTPPDRAHAYLVFGQSAAARFEIDTWDRNATRFFRTKVGLTVEKKYSPDRASPAIDIARVIVAEDGEPPALRTVYARAVSESDLGLALRAEVASKTNGLHLLARRCPTIWTIDAADKDDRASLLLAAILASALLGPIIAPDAGAIFGVRTARIELEKLKSRDR